MSARLQKPCVITFQGQFFHVLPTTQGGRASSLFRADRKQIQACLTQICPDLVHGWGTEDVYALAAVQSGFPSIVSMQGILSYYALKNRLPGRAYLQALLEIYILYRARVITTESEWGRKVILRRNPGAQVELVEYGVQDHFLDISWQPDPAKPVVIFVGGADPRKGIQDLVEAFRSPSLAGVELWVVGAKDSPWATALEKDASSNVHWLGRRTSEETAALMQKAWCLALPTRADTSPNVVKEARVIGMPIITTPHGGQIAYVREGQTGFLVEPGAIANLIEKISILTTNFSQIRKMGVCLHEEQRILLNAQKTADHFLAIYQKIYAA